MLTISTVLYYTLLVSLCTYNGLNRLFLNIRACIYERSGDFWWKEHISRKNCTDRRFTVSERECPQLTVARCLLAAELKAEKHCLTENEVGRQWKSLFLLSRIRISGVFIIAEKQLFVPGLSYIIWKIGQNAANLVSQPVKKSATLCSVTAQKESFVRPIPRWLITLMCPLAAMILSLSPETDA